MFISPDIEKEELVKVVLLGIMRDNPQEMGKRDPTFRGDLLRIGTLLHDMPVEDLRYQMATGTFNFCNG